MSRRLGCDRRPRGAIRCRGGTATVLVLAALAGCGRVGNVLDGGSSSGDGVKTVTHSSGVTFSYPADWSASDSGANAVLTPPPREGQAESHVRVMVGAEAWTSPMAITDPRVVSALVQGYASALGGMQLDGTPQTLGNDGVYFRFAGHSENGPLSVVVLDKLTGTTKINVMVAGAAAEAAAIEPVAAEIFRIAQPASQGTSGGAGSWPPSDPRAGQPAPQGGGSLDRDLIGVWSSSSSQSSSRGPGSFTIATQHIYTFAADGSWSLGSQSAGGNEIVPIMPDFQLHGAGRWSVGSNGQDRIIVLQHQQGQTTSVPYTWHNGLLVTGTPGNRSFWSRIQ